VPASGNIRFFRTSLLGRAPGFAPAPPLVGPWRDVQVVAAGTPTVDLRTTFDGADGAVTITCAPGAGELEVSIGDIAAQLPPGGGTVRVPRPEVWWPHTHGEPALYPVRVGTAAGAARRRIGFRRLDHATDVERDGPALVVNGVPVFARGAVWTPTRPEEVRPTLERARDGGLNLIRVVGTMVYEDDAFHDLCDELGLLVWQDLMFANLDYPFVDNRFRALAVEEVRQALRTVAGRPSLAVVCGNSEIEQQVAMLGLSPELARDEFFTVDVPGLMREAELDAAYLPSAPTGGVRPFRTDRGVANYFGVGAYLRPLDDVRRSAVRFASECLAFANVPDDDPRDREEGVMRDVGAAWDFADVRDHYLRELHGVTEAAPDYWDHARRVTGELMASVFGEWRRSASPCSGGIVLWLRDLAPGSGWGLLDSEGRPKAAWHLLRRAVAPVALWFVDEGLNGLAVHAANDTGSEIGATLRLALYRDEAVLLEEVEVPLALASHTTVERDVEDILGRFVDIGFTYRFGEMQHDTVVATLHADGRELSQAFFTPHGGARQTRVPASELGLEIEANASEVRVSSSRVVRGLRLRAAGHEPEDDEIDLEPGRSRVVRLRRVDERASLEAVTVGALNLEGELQVPVA
jgi:beta-mannosidase